jgi:hypothetical protein
MPIHTTDITPNFLSTQLNIPDYIYIPQGLYLIIEKVDFLQRKLLVNHYNKKRKCVLNINVTLYGLKENARLLYKLSPTD